MGALEKAITVSVIRCKLEHTDTNSGLIKCESRLYKGRNQLRAQTLCSMRVGGWGQHPVRGRERKDTRSRALRMPPLVNNRMDGTGQEPASREITEQDIAQKPRVLPRRGIAYLKYVE